MQKAGSKFFSTFIQGQDGGKKSREKSTSAPPETFEKASTEVKPSAKGSKKTVERRFARLSDSLEEPLLFSSPEAEAAHPLKQDARQPVPATSLTAEHASSTSKVPSPLRPLTRRGKAVSKPIDGTPDTDDKVGARKLNTRRQRQVVAQGVVPKQPGKARAKPAVGPLAPIPSYAELRARKSVWTGLQGANQLVKNVNATLGSEAMRSKAEPVPALPALPVPLEAVFHASVTAFTEAMLSEDTDAWLLVPHESSAQRAMEGLARQGAISAKQMDHFLAQGGVCRRMIRELRGWHELRLAYESRLPKDEQARALAKAHIGLAWAQEGLVYLEGDDAIAIQAFLEGPPPPLDAQAYMAYRKAHLG